jgi:putative ABC transport system ATP-binding protein
MITIKSLYKSYDNIQILEDVNLSINNGDFIILSGPSGSGKSTLLSLISGLSRPTSGEVIFDGINISKLPEYDLGKFRNEKIGFVFQKYNLIEELTVYENVLVPLIVTNYNNKQLNELITRTLTIFGINDKTNVKVKKLSGGEQQRVALSRALVNNPEVIIADEPTANLDPRLKKSVIELFTTINKLGKTVIIATHDEIFRKIEHVKVAYIKNGTIVQYI